MEEKGYNFSKRTDRQYDFLSKSKTKNVNKVVIFSQKNRENLFNTALLDLFENGEMSDISVTNNGDLKEVMATVFHILDDFLNEFPRNIVSFSGSDDKRQRLYRIIISKELDNINRYFVILGLNNGIIEKFVPNKEYELYIVRKR